MCVFWLVVLVSCQQGRIFEVCRHTQHLTHSSRSLTNSLPPCVTVTLFCSHLPLPLPCHSSSPSPSPVYNQQCTVNNQIVIGTLMNICDDPNRVSIGAGWRENDTINRVPIIVTGRRVVLRWWWCGGGVFWGVQLSTKAGCLWNGCVNCQDATLLDGGQRTWSLTPSHSTHTLYSPLLTPHSYSYTHTQTTKQAMTFPRCTRPSFVTGGWRSFTGSHKGRRLSTLCGRWVG